MRLLQASGRRLEVDLTYKRGDRRSKRLVEPIRHFLETLHPQRTSFTELAKYADLPQGAGYPSIADSYELIGAVTDVVGEETLKWCRDFAPISQSPEQR